MFRLEAGDEALDLGMPRVPSADLSDCRNHHARSKVPLRAWFMAAYLLATHSNGMSALQLQAKLDLNEYVFRWNRRHSYSSAFDQLVGIGVSLKPMTRADIMAST